MWEIIYSFTGIFILGLGEILFAKIVLNSKLKIQRLYMILVLVLTTALSTLSYMYTSGLIKTIIICIIHVLEYKTVFDITLAKSFFLTFLYMIILIIPDILELLIITNIFGLDKSYCYNNFAGSIEANIITCILFIIITYILKKPLRKVVNIEINTNIKIIVLSVITLIPISLLFYSLVKTFKFSNNIINYLIALLVLVVILFTLIKQTIDSNRMSREYDKLLETMTTFENEIEKQRILRHEAKNELLTIRAKICDNQENKEIVGYIDEILKEKIKVKQEEYAKFGYLPPNGIKGLCYFKVQEAEEKNIKVALNISKRIKSSTIYDLDTKQQKDFARILGVILDNAIEASEISQKKQIGIEAYMSNNKEFKMIISNTYSNNIDQSKIGHEKTSTKGKNRGHGLLLVKNIINKNKILKLKTEIQNEIYTQTIIVKKSIE